jgi:hypothetical protein
MNALPEWTERLDKRGLDPLGMQNSGVLLYQSLLPGISNVTLRMRYYGFYCWVSDAYAHVSGSTDFAQWQQWVRRCEALFALAASRAASASGAQAAGVGGIEWAGRTIGRTVEAGGDEIDFTTAASTDRAADIYLLQPMGVFGGAYSSQLVEVGLFEMGPDGLQRASPAGRTLAGLFRAAIGGTAEATFLAAIDQGKVTLAQLDALGGLVPGNIEAPSEERGAYETLLFAPRDTASESSQSRRASLELILWATLAVDRRPDEAGVRWFMFEPAAPIPSHLEPQRLRWEAYQCQDLFQVAAAALLDWAIELLGAAPEGLFLDELRGLMRAGLEAALAEEAVLPWSHVRAQSSGETFDFRAAWMTLTGRRGARGERALLGLRVIAALDARLSDRAALAEMVAQTLRPHSGARSIVSELRWIREREAQPLIDLAIGYMIDRIVRRHGWVALQKLRRQRDYTFLFEARDNRLVRLSAYQPVATTPRMAPAIQFLDDIDLVDGAGLTARGRAMLGTNA